MRLVLLGYSKGTPDILEAVATYPDLQKRVSAVISVSGAVGGSPLANTVTQSVLNLLQYFPDAECDPGDEGALESLRPEVRKRWPGVRDNQTTAGRSTGLQKPDEEQRQRGCGGHGGRADHR
jgi:pimeloyl-ACP methyl ester carboxylesterase